MFYTPFHIIADPKDDVPHDDLLVQPCAVSRAKRINQGIRISADFKPVVNDYDRPNVSKLVTDEEMGFLRSLIRDANIRECMKDVLIYDSNEHGFSMQTLLSRIRAHQNKIRRPDHFLIMSTLSRKSLFGAYVTYYWDQSQRGYYGDPMTVLFRLRPGPRKAYPYLGGEARFQLCRPGVMGVGGGLDSGPCGIYFESDMKFGHSGPSPTFRSKCLVTAPEDQLGLGRVHEKEGQEFCHFKIGAIEVISFVDEIDWEEVGRRYTPQPSR